MKTYKVRIYRTPHAELMADILNFSVRSPTKADAILDAQKEAARVWKLTPLQEALLQVHFIGGAK